MRVSQPASWKDQKILPSFMFHFGAEREEESENDLPTSAVFSNAKVPYFGVVCP
jgi:hypothetical protein